MKNEDSLQLERTPTGVLLKVKVVPGSSRNRIAGIWNGSLKVSVTAPPEKGKANHALIRLLADLLNVPANRLSIHRGETSPFKMILVNGLSPKDIFERLKQAGIRMKTPSR